MFGYDLTDKGMSYEQLRKNIYEETGNTWVAKTLLIWQSETKKAGILEQASSRKTFTGKIINIIADINNKTWRTAKINKAQKKHDMEIFWIILVYTMTTI